MGRKIGNTFCWGAKKTLLLHTPRDTEWTLPKESTAETAHKHIAGPGEPDCVPYLDTGMFLTAVKR